MTATRLTFVNDNGELNPYSPITEFWDWYYWDPVRADACCRIYAKETEISEETPLEEQEHEKEAAVDFILANDVTGLYRKHTQDI